ncbi:hypothetical protein [Dietzia cinnamea]|uniref:hypothetical protein n=1 Tax=Dietzia cinnamea TaxID=321318 RepID=UPI001EF7D9EA|nr:hypothetical protein [Dietzia cinnamea]MCT2265320.1 hypothetical protein [Dietzia cinnamea]
MAWYAEESGHDAVYLSYHHPLIFLGGGGAAARRAGRLGMHCQPQLDGPALTALESLRLIGERVLPGIR